MEMKDFCLINICKQFKDKLSPIDRTSNKRIFILKNYVYKELPYPFVLLLYCKDMIKE